MPTHRPLSQSLCQNVAVVTISWKAPMDAAQNAPNDDFTFRILASINHCLMARDDSGTAKRTTNEMRNGKWPAEQLRHKFLIPSACTDGCSGRFRLLARSVNPCFG